MWSGGLRDPPSLGWAGLPRGCGFFRGKRAGGEPAPRVRAPDCDAFDAGDYAGSYGADCSHGDNSYDHGHVPDRHCHNPYDDGDIPDRHGDNPYDHGDIADGHCHNPYDDGDIPDRHGDISDHNHGDNRDGGNSASDGFEYQCRRDDIRDHGRRVGAVCSGDDIRRDSGHVDDSIADRRHGFGRGFGDGAFRRLDGDSPKATLVLERRDRGGGVWFHRLA